MKTQNEDYGYYWATKSHLYHHLGFDWVRYDSQGFQGFDKSIGKWIKMRGEFEADKDILEEMGQPNIVGVLAKIAERLGYTGPFHYDETKDALYHDLGYYESKIYEKGEWIEIESSKPFNDPEPKYQGRESVAERIIDQIKIYRIMENLKKEIQDQQEINEKEKHIKEYAGIGTDEDLKPKINSLLMQYLPGDVTIDQADAIAMAIFKCISNPEDFLKR